MPLLYVLLAVFSLLITHPLASDTWVEDGHNQLLSSHRCDIPKIDASKLSREEFREKFLEKTPVIILGSTSTGIFSAAVQKHRLLARYANHTVTLSSANKNSYAKKEVSLSRYVHDMMSPVSLAARGSETWYMFGDNKHAQWEDVFALYEQPTKYIYGKYASLSFGIGASGSGVPFHTHGHVFAEVFYGRKRWWLAPFSNEPIFDPDETPLRWLHTVYPVLTGEKTDFEDVSIETEHGAVALSSVQAMPSAPPHFYECTLGPGELLYIPTRWHHSTLNIGETVFMSVFV